MGDDSDDDSSGASSSSALTERTKEDQVEGVLVACGNSLFTNPRFVLGVAWDNGGRPFMQDAFCVSLSKKDGADNIDFIGVFDGQAFNASLFDQFSHLYISLQAMVHMDRTSLNSQPTACLEMYTTSMKACPKPRPKSTNIHCPKPLKLATLTQTPT